MLKLHHRKVRVLWDKKYMHWTDEWLNIFFGEEKKITWPDTGHTTRMIYDENLESSSVDKEERVLSWCGARSASTEQPALLFLMVDRPLKIIKMSSKAIYFQLEIS